MAASGPLYPATIASLANAGTSENANAWTNPANAGADDATEAQITAATYDSPDISEILVASNFGFTIPAGATIDGITVEIDRRSIIVDSGKDFRVQLATGTTFATLVGTNKAATATIWPSTTAVATYGGAADTWSSGLTASQVNATGFAVFLSAQANIANADIGVDFIRATVTYTDNQTVTPGVAALSLTAFASTVTASDHQTVTPGVASLALTTFAPTVGIGVNVVPGVAALTLSAFAPVVAVTDTITVTPGVTALTLAAFAPVVTATDHKLVTPGTASLAMAASAPTVTATDHQVATPGVAALSLTTYAPIVTAGGVGIAVTPDTALLSLTTFAPDVTVSARALTTVAYRRWLVPARRAPVGHRPDDEDDWAAIVAALLD